MTKKKKKKNSSGCEMHAADAGITCELAPSA
jgi:hypothetical protein